MEEQKLNYFHYYTDVEEHFVRQRRKNLFISPLDWSLIAAWKESGIPLNVVLRGIDRAFTSFESGKRKSRLVNTLFYCQQAVQECFAEYGDSRIGAAKETPTDRESFVLEEVESLFGIFQQRMNHAAKQAKEEGYSSLAEIFEKNHRRLHDLLQEIRSGVISDLNLIERDLQSMDTVTAVTIMDAVGEDSVKEWRHQAAKELRPYKKRVGGEMYEKIVNNYLQRCARQRFGLPALSMHSI